MEVPQLPEHVPETLESAGGFPVQPAEAAGPLPPPRPLKPAWLKAVNATCIVAAAATGLVALTMAIPGRTCGATRSCRLKQEQRQQEIAAAQQEDAQAITSESEGSD
jgi:hypothetical protein